MANFLTSLGTGIGGFMAGYNQSYEAGLKQALAREQLQANQQQQQSAGAAFNALKGFSPQNITGLPGSQNATPPPMPGQSSLPQQPAPQPQQPPAENPYAPALSRPQPLTPDQVATAGPIISRDESNNQNIPQGVYSGRGINPSTGTHTPPSTASGYNQITDTTWRESAPKAGVDINKFPTAISAPRELQDKVRDYLLSTRGTADYAPFNPRLAADLAKAGIPGGFGPHTAAGSGPAASVTTQIPPPLKQEAQQTANTAATQSPDMVFGGANMQQMAQAIDRANPGASPIVKFGALSMMFKLMQPEQRLQLQMLMKDNQQQFQLALKQMEIDAANQRTLLVQGNKGTAQVLTDPSNNKPYLMNPNKPGSATDLQGNPYTPGGAAKIGPAQPPSPFTDSDVDYWSTVLKNGGTMPPGLARTAAGSQFVQKVMAKMGRGGDPNDFIANVSIVKADQGSLRNMVKMTDAATSFERTASKNFDLALTLSANAIPTDWGPWINKWVETGETQAGNTDVPPYVTALLTGANEYAKIMSGSTGSTGSTVDSRREAAELFSPYLNKGQIDRVVAIAKQDMANRKASLYGQVDDIKERLRTAGSGKPTATQGQPPAAQSAPAGRQWFNNGTVYSDDGKTFFNKDGTPYQEPQ